MSIDDQLLQFETLLETTTDEADRRSIERLMWFVRSTSEHDTQSKAQYMKRMREAMPHLTEH